MTDMGVPFTPKGSTMTNAGAILFFCASRYPSVPVMLSSKVPEITLTLHFSGSSGVNPSTSLAR